MSNITFNPRKIVVALFNLLVFSVPLYFRFVNEELFEFNKMILVYMLTSLIVFFWLSRMIQAKKLIFRKTALDVPILLFLVSQIISTIFSIHPRTSMLGYYSRFNGGLFSTISYILLFYAFVSNFRRKDLGSLLVSIFSSSILVSIYGILEHFGHSVSCVLAPGPKNFDANCWKQDVVNRVFATFGQPNWLAAYVITLFPLSLVISIQKKYQLYRRVFFAVASVLLLAVLIFTKSRSGMIGLAGGSAILAISLGLMLYKNKQKLFSKLDLKFFGILVAVLFAVVTFFGTPITPSISEVFEKSSPQVEESTQDNTQAVVNRLEVGGTDSGEIRKIVWSGALAVWKRYPIVGSGVETFAYSYYQDRLTQHNNVSEWDFLYNKAHNELLNLMANSGIVGLITYLSIFVALFILTLKTLISNKKFGVKLASAAIFSGVVALSISNFFGFSTVAVNTLMFVLFGFFIIINFKEEKKEKKTEKKKTVFFNSGEQYFGFTLLAIFLLVTLVKIYNYWDADKLYSEGTTYFNSGEYLLGIQKQVEAINKSPNEALFYDTISDDYSKLALELARAGEATAAATFAQEALRTSNLAIENNDRHLNFYKTRARVFVTLASLDESFLNNAKETLNQAIALSPSDPKLFYTMAVIELSEGNNEAGKKLLEKSLELKPNYEKARLKMASFYEENQEFELAIENLQYIIDNISPDNQAVKDKIKELEVL